jgi:hypothetical protein
VWLLTSSTNGLPNPNLTVDATAANGVFILVNSRASSGFNERMSFISDSIKAVGTYPIKTNSKTIFSYGKYKLNNAGFFCEFDNTIYGANQSNIDGFLKITRYDAINKIYAGEFEISFINNACELGSPVKITAGRFDIKL